MRRLSSLCRASSSASSCFPKAFPASHLNTETCVPHLRDFRNPKLAQITGIGSPISSNNEEQSDYNNYVSRILTRKDWCLLLNHEYRAKRIALNTRFIVSVLQNQQCPLLSLKFYLWVTNREPPFAKDRTVKRVLGGVLYRLGPVVLSPQLISEVRDAKYAIDEDLLCILIGSWGRLGLAKYCDEVFGQISFLRIAPSTRLYNAVIDALIKSNSLDMAYLKFQQMASDNCKPDRFTYNILIHGVCRIGVVDEALRLVKQMEVSGYRPNVFTYTILIDGFCKANRLNDVGGVLETMKLRNVNLNEATVRSFVNGVFQCAPPQEAFELVIRFIEKEQAFQSLACETLMYCLSSRSMAEETGTLFKTLLKRGYTPSSAVVDITISCLIQGLDLTQTCEIVDICIDRSIRLGFSTYLALIEALYRARRIAEADHYIYQIAQDGYMTNVYSYNMIIDCYCKGNLMDRAMNSLHEMLHKSIAPNLVTFNTLICGHCKSEGIKQAMELLELIFQHGFKPDVFTFSSLIDGLCRVRRFKDALDCLREMKAWGICPNGVVYDTIIRGLCLIGDVQRAMRLMKEMEKNQIKPDVFCFNALIQCFCRMGKIEKAQQLYDSMLMMGVSPDSFTYGAFIKALCALGRLQEAKELFLSLDKNSLIPDPFLCNLILTNLSKQGHLDDVKSITKMCRDKGILIKSYE